MKKIILTFIAMLLAGVNTAWADDVAQIGETKYQSLSTAFADANDNSGSTLYLLKDVTLGEDQVLHVRGNFILDLNGKKITANSSISSNQNGCAILLRRGATLTVNDASGNNSGTISNTNSNPSAAIRVMDLRDEPSDYSAPTNKTTLVINGGTFTSGRNGIAGFGRCHNTEIIINGGVISGGSGSGIYHPQIGTLTINGGSISGASTAVYMRAGNLTIEDGTFTATSTWNNNPSTPIPAAIQIDQYDDTERSGLQKPIEVNINGGTFIATQDNTTDVPTDTDTDSKALTVTNTYNNDEAMGSVVVNITDGDFQGGILKTDTRTTTKINISGGTYSYIVDEANCAEGSSPVTTPNNDGKYTVINNVPAVIDGEVQIVSGNITTPYETLAGAFADVQDGETIELLKNVTLSSDIVCPLTSGTIYFKFGRFKVNKGNSSIKLKIAAANGARAAVPAATVGGPVVYTDNQTDIFTAAGSGNVLLVNYDPTNTTYPYSYQTVPGDQSIDEALARNEQTGMLFSDLQSAVDLAQAGQTITVLKDVALATTVNVNKGIIIEGGHHTITAANFKPALKVTGTGDVTINKTKIDTYYENVDVNGYTDGGIAILADNGYSGKLTVDYCHLVTSNRGIDIQKVGAGFSLDVKNDTITGKRANVTDPKTQYINTFNYDPYQTARGINFSNGTVALNAKVENTLIQGLAYALNISNTGSHVELDVKDCTFYGRGGVNVHGSSNVVNLDNVTVNGLNNQLVGLTETFACIVEDAEAKYNDYNLKDVRAKASVLAGPNDGPNDPNDPTSGTNATEMFIDLRGSDATVKIKGNSGYDIDAEDRDRVGFMNDDEMQRLLDPSANNRIFFDDQSKEYFTYWFEKITPWPNTFDAQNRKVRLDIKDGLDAIIGLHQVVPIYPVVQVTIDTENFYYDSLAKAINGEFFENGADVIILDNITMDEDITPNLKRGEEFTLTSLKDINGTSYSINKNGHKIFLDPLVIANYDIDAENYDYYDNPTGLFAPSDSTITTVLIRKTEDLVGTNYVPRYVYTAANVYWSGDVNDIDPDLSFYWLWDELFTKDENAVAVFAPDTYTRLEMDLTLTSDRKLPTSMGGFEWEEEGEPARRMVDDIVGMKYWLDFNNFTIDKSDYSIALIVGDSVYTTATTDVFSSADPAYYVTYDVLASDSIKENEKGANVLFKYRYYLQKDGLAVTVDPATFCGDRLTPTFQVKKKVTDPATNTDTWKVVNGITKEEYDNRIAAAAANIPPTDPDLDGVDFYWYLVPPVSADDDSTYVSAKTYHGALVIEGITFQGTRKADFTILPRDIKDVVVKDSTNILKWRAEGYTPAQIADTLLLVYNCLTHNSDTLLTKYNATTKKGDYLISVADGPEAGGKYLEVDTYSQVITVTAVEGGNYTGTLKLDFTILQDGLIDISKCMVVSDATYTSDPLPPLKSRLKVILKDPATGTETVVDSAAYTLEVHGAPESYINAQTYSNAITIKGRSTYIPSDGSSTTPVKGYYGSLDADYVIKPRDLADSLDVIAEKDNQGKVTLEAYAGANEPATTPATIYLKWTGSELVPVINGAVTDPVSNNINLILTAQKDTLPGQTTSAKVVYPLIAADYSYTIEPAPMVDPGIYKVIFTGRGNFTGMREVNVMVLKDINELADNIKMPYQIIPDNLALTPSQMKGIEVKDGNKVLVENEEYTLVIKGGKPGEIFDETTPIYVKGKYYAYFYGKEPYYTGQYVDDFRAFFEYIGWDTNSDAGTGTNIYNNPTSKAKKPATNGNIIASSGLEYDDTNTTPVSVRITDVSDSLNLKAEITYIDNINEETVTACDPTKEIVKVKPTFQIVAGLDNGAARYFTFNIVGVQDNAFKDLPIIHCLDLTQIEGYTPDNLTRSEDGPFNYYPVQSLVYFDGTRGADVSGTNYIYVKSTDDETQNLCEELKIYDDMKGNQKGFEPDDDYEGGGYAWEFRNVYPFTAAKVTNTRYFTKGQHYTTCLPYRMEMPADMKVYTLDAASDKIFGFKELSLDSLRAFTPYLLIPSKAGNMLNNPGSTIVYVTPTADEGKLNPVVTPTGSATPNATMYGSMIYMDKNTTVPLVEGLYIMQSQNTWLQIPADNEYNKACVLPMRAYIGVPVASPSREIMYSKFVDAVEKLKVDVADDWTNAEVYDLQGRKVDTTARLPKGVYIVNGQKRIRK